MTDKRADHIHRLYDRIEKLESDLARSAEDYRELYDRHTQLLQENAELRDDKSLRECIEVQQNRIWELEAEVEKLTNKLNAERAGGWVSVEERLPEIPDGDDSVLVLGFWRGGVSDAGVRSRDFIGEALLWKRRAIWTSEVRRDPTHWMPRPAPPTGGE